MKLNIVEDIDRIRALLATDNLNVAIAQYPDTPYDIHELGTSYYFIISDNELDIGIYIVDRLSYDNHFSVHVGYIKSARGFQAYAGGMLFIDYMKQLLPHACLLGMPPLSKPGAIRHAQMIGFELKAIVPQAIAKDKDKDAERIDMAILAINW